MEPADWQDREMERLEAENAKLRLKEGEMDEDKVLTYEEAKRLCRIAFDAGADYGSTSMQFNCNAVAYDWDHWLKKNEGLFKPKPTVDDVLRELVDALDIDLDADFDATIAEYAAKLRLAGDE